MPRVYSELNNKPLQLYSLKYLGIQLTRQKGNLAKRESVNSRRGRSFLGVNYTTKTRHNTQSAIGRECKPRKSQGKNLVR